MTVDELNEAKDKFKAAFKKYQTDMEAKFNAATDEVGCKLSKYKVDGKCPLLRFM